MKITTKQLAHYAADHIMNGASSQAVAQAVASLLVAERRSRDVGAFGRLLESELAARGKTQVTVTSAVPVSDDIKKQLAVLLGVNQDALFHEVVDPHVIGGVAASTQHARIDLTVAGQLKQIKQAINKEAN